MTAEEQTKVAMTTLSPVSWIEVKILASDPRARRKTVTAESWPVLPLR